MRFQSSSRLYAAVSSLLWPAILCAGLTGAYFAFNSDMHLLWFNVVYLSTVAVIAFFERLMPYEKTWLKRDDETFNDVAHTLLNKGGVQIAAAIGTSFPMAVQRKPDETVVFSWIAWPSKAVRDEGMKKAMADPRLQAGMNPMPFDGPRMIFGGFEVIVDA